jgi:alpha-glucosidase
LNIEIVLSHQNDRLIGLAEELFEQVLVALLTVQEAGQPVTQQGDTVRRQIQAGHPAVVDVRDPIGITGWPAEKGRDGERTPMQWDTSNRQAGFSNNARTWLPVPASYERINVRSELADRDSVLRWYQNLIQLRRSQAALREGRTVMLDPRNASVLSYVRVDTHGDAVLVSLNMSPTPQTISLDLSDAGFESCNFTTLMASPAPNSTHGPERSIELPPFAAWVARAQPCS